MVIIWVDTENIYNWSPVVDKFHNNIDEIKLFLGHNRYSEDTFKYFNFTYKKISKYFCKVGTPDALDYELLNYLHMHLLQQPEDRHLILSNDKIYYKYRSPNILYYSLLSKFNVGTRNNILKDFLMYC